MARRNSKPHPDSMSAKVLKLWDKGTLPVHKIAEAVGCELTTARRAVDRYRSADWPVENTRKKIALRNGGGK
jgi:hypothetical protein